MNWLNGLMWVGWTLGFSIAIILALRAIIWIGDWVSCDRHRFWIMLSILCLFVVVGIFFAGASQ
jgi:hypothetical protein